MSDLYVLPDAKLLELALSKARKALEDIVDLEKDYCDSSCRLNEAVDIAKEGLKFSPKVLGEPNCTTLKKEDWID